LRAFAAFFARRLGTLPTIGAKLQIAFAQPDGLRNRALSTRALENGLDSALSNAALAVTANDGNDFCNHGAAPFIASEADYYEIVNGECDTKFSRAACEYRPLLWLLSL
jgi:hypothetical protein